MLEWWANKKNLFLYTAVLIGIFISVMIWMTPPGRSDRHPGKVTGPSQAIVQQSPDAPPAP
jgi:hypothetical protein